jgi:hypothetical protein
LPEVKKVLRSLVVVMKGPVKKVFIRFPPLERAVRALLRRFPRLAAAYRRSIMTPAGLSTAADSARISAEAPARKVALSTHAAMIFQDLQCATERQRLKSMDTSTAQRPL